MLLYSRHELSASLVYIRCITISAIYFVNDSRMFLILWSWFFGFIFLINLLSLFKTTYTIDFSAIFSDKINFSIKFLVYGKGKKKKRWEHGGCLRKNEIILQFCWNFFANVCKKIRKRWDNLKTLSTKPKIISLLWQIQNVCVFYCVLIKLILLLLRTFICDMVVS